MTSDAKKSLTVRYEDVVLARERIKDHIHYTPVFTSQTLNKIVRENGEKKNLDEKIEEKIEKKKKKEKQKRTEKRQRRKKKEK